MKKAERESSPSARAGTDGELLFVYGTLRRRSRHPMHEVLCAHADFVGAGTFRGKLYDLGAFPGAVASDQSPDQVRGEIYALRDPQRILPALDAYEAQGFRREIVAIRSEAGATLRCWIYLYDRPVSRSSLISSGDYIRHRG